MNILNAIRRNWLWLTLCLLLFTISLTKNFPMFKHSLSWWNVCWIFVPAALMILAGGNSWYILRPVRWFQWPMQKEYLEQKMRGITENMLVYPSLLWLEFHGQKAYVDGGMKAVSDGMLGAGRKVADTMTDFVNARAAERHACDCHNPECAHGEPLYKPAPGEFKPTGDLLRPPMVAEHEPA